MVRVSLILFGIFVTLATPLNAEKPREPNQSVQETNPIDPNLEQAINDALKAIQRESPLVHEDSLRVWKNFSSRSKAVNFTYRFWGRRIILWLKEEKKIAFQSEEQVGEVFKILWRKGLISKNAAVVLMADAWYHLVYLEGSPSWEKRMENRTPPGGAAPTGARQPKSPEQAI